MISNTTICGSEVKEKKLQAECVNRSGSNRKQVK